MSALLRDYFDVIEYFNYQIVQSETTLIFLYIKDYCNYLLHIQILSSLLPSTLFLYSQFLSNSLIHTSLL